MTSNPPRSQRLGAPLRAALLLVVLAVIASGCTMAEIRFFNRNIRVAPKPRIPIHLASDYVDPADPYGYADYEQYISDAGLLRLRLCESSDRYTVTNPTGKFRGAYQFWIPTWDGVAERHFPHLVGVDPIDAPPEAQDAMARALWSERGRQPWPQCGLRV